MVRGFQIMTKTISSKMHHSPWKSHESFFIYRGVQGPRTTWGRELQSKNRRICGYVWVIKISPKYEQIKIVRNSVVNIWELIPQDSPLWEKSCLRRTYILQRE